MNQLDANLIIANAPDPVFVSDFQGKILLANEAVSELLGFRKDEVLEQSLSRFVSLDEARELMAALREVVEHDVSRNVRLNPHSASGEVIATTLNASALRRSGPTPSSSPTSRARSSRPTMPSTRSWGSVPPRSSSSRCHVSSASMRRASSWPRSARSWPAVSPATRG